MDIGETGEGRREKGQGPQGVYALISGESGKWERRSGRTVQNDIPSSHNINEGRNSTIVIAAFSHSTSLWEINTHTQRNPSLLSSKRIKIT